MKSRRFCQFSLKSLFVLVTLVALPCGYVAWQREIVEVRRVMLGRIKEIGGDYREPLTPLEYYMMSSNVGYHSPLGNLSERASNPPDNSWLRRILGDKPIEKIWLPDNSPADMFALTHDTFPEADIYHPAIGEPYPDSTHPLDVIAD